MPRWRELGGEVLVVTFTPPERMKAFLEKHPLPFRIVTDPQRDAYRAFALGRVSYLAFLRPRVMWGYMKRLLQGWRPAAPTDDDLLQLGGDFLIDAEGRLAWVYASKEPTDRPSAMALRAAMEKCCAT